jgi:hypothetical protein
MNMTLIFEQTTKDRGNSIHVKPFFHLLLVYFLCDWNKMQLECLPTFGIRNSFIANRKTYL